METVKVRTHTDSSGTLRLELPTELVSRDIEVLVVFQPIQGGPFDDLGWPIGYFEETYGSFAADPLERGPQGEFETREPLE